MQADAIFLRTPKYNRSVFFGGREAPLGKKDPRIRSIPFATRRATFSEITRVHDVLSVLQIYGMYVSIYLSIYLSLLIFRLVISMIYINIDSIVKGKKL